VIRAALWIGLGTALGLGAAFGCSGGNAREVECSFGDEHVLAAARGRFDAIRAFTLGGGPAAAYSSSEGTYVQRLSPVGEASGAPLRLGPACPSGLDAIGLSDGGAVIACRRPALPHEGKAGAQSVIFLEEDLSVRERRSFGDVGPGSRGITVAEHPAGQAVVAYFDAEKRAVFLAEITRGQPIEPRIVSRDGPTPAPPALFVDGDRLLLTWAETITDPSTNTLIGEVLVSDLSGAPRRFASVLYDDAQPRLLRDDQGLVLAYRDENPAGSRVGLFVDRVDSRLTRANTPTRVGRSDAPSGVSLFPCAGGIYSVAAHTYGRREMLVGIARLDSTLASIAGERQVYRAGARYEHGVGLCADNAALVLVANRAPSAAGEATVKAMTLRCER